MDLCRCQFGGSFFESAQPATMTADLGVNEAATKTRHGTGKVRSRLQNFECKSDRFDIPTFQHAPQSF